ncbi:mannose-1-phosphate guanylyltransferase/mannose-6-phosphate isomerase, partial [Planktomarina temperata]|nr:mannose-1-phosphate guanylyltransferase/mannose-6-phosphate isomerase [Planktomarina temperata]
KSAQRLTSSSKLDFEEHITLTNAAYRFIVIEQLQEVGLDPGPILIEPEAKNTAAAILAASMFARSKDANPILLVAPSDHVIPDTNAFHEAVRIGLNHVHDGKMITFGIKATHPETAYGYLELSPNSIDSHGTSDLKNFIEKPDIEHAKQMTATGNFLWNAGIFLFKAQDMIDAFSEYAPNTLEFVEQSVADATIDLGFIRLSSEPWSKLDDISIDYAVMEKARNLVAVPYSSKWSDLGGWDAVWADSGPDQDGNVVSKNAHAIECTNCLLRSESGAQQIVGLGLDSILAIAMPDAVLVTHKEKAQDIKHVVEVLKADNIPQAEIFPKDHRPWGWFESLALGERFQVKRILVKPGAALSLQSHTHRSEHWIVVEGTAKVTIEDDVKLISEGESVYIPLGALHRMENPGKLPMVLIEVQTGAYLGEDDIVRYEDLYSRDVS